LDQYTPAVAAADGGRDLVGQVRWYGPGAEKIKPFFGSDDPSS
jgi:hypothetical protein